MVSRSVYLTVKQRKAVIMLAEGMSRREVADKIEVAESSIRNWEKENDLFQKELSKRIEEIVGIDGDYRRRRSQSMLYALYKEFTDRQVGDSSFKNLSDKDLLKSVVLIQHELRLDTPGDVTGKIASGKLNDLQSRYQKSNSGQVFRDNMSIIKRVPRVGKVSVKSADNNKETSEDN